MWAARAGEGFCAGAGARARTVERAGDPAQDTSLGPSPLGPLRVSGIRQAAKPWAAAAGRGRNCGSRRCCHFTREPVNCTQNAVSGEEQGPGQGRAQNRGAPTASLWVPATPRAHTCRRRRVPGTRARPGGATPRSRPSSLPHGPTCRAALSAGDAAFPAAVCLQRVSFKHNAGEGHGGEDARSDHSSHEEPAA